MSPRMMSRFPCLLLLAGALVAPLAASARPLGGSPKQEKEERGPANQQELERRACGANDV